jgi:hypothetical protein
MIVDYLTFTFAEEHEDKLADLIKKIDPDAAAVETKSGYTEYWTPWGSGWLKWGHRGKVLAHLSLSGSALALYRKSGGDVGTPI